MFNNYSVLAVIPARGGSKGIPRKNIREIAGKPLIAWTIEEAKKSKYIDRLIISSEDEEIIDVAKSWGCEVPFIRPKELAKDDTPGIEPILHAIKMLPKYDYVVLLQPTSPLRLVEDIDKCIEFCINKQASSCVTVSEPDKNPFWMYYVNDNGGLQPILEVEFMNRRQELPKVFSLNGAIYISKVEWLNKNKTFINRDTLAYIMPKERSLDIDDEYDMIIAKAIITERFLMS